ncbi:MAG TPA: hypothetical protein VGP32_05085 [Steroidobacteraceae bacterium]|nr:hypothetical protein [Steroidobacteraceae bacterium]
MSLILLCPLATNAADLDVPELGVRLTGLPDGMATPRIIARAGGHEAITRARAAELSVYREDALARADSDVADPAYRASLDTRFDPTIDSRTAGAPTSLGGHNAWTVVDARQQAAQTIYDCVTYVIVDQHLYRFAVRASAGQGRPAEFDALVRALSQVSFEPVLGTEVAAPHAAAPQTAAPQTAAPPPCPRGSALKVVLRCWPPQPAGESRDGGRAAQLSRGSDHRDARPDEGVQRLRGGEQGGSAGAPWPDSRADRA